MLVDALSLLAWPQVPWARLVDWQFLRDGCEELLYVLARFRRCLEEEQASLAGILFGVGGGDGALVGRFGNKIELVSGQSDDDILVRLALKLLNPRFGLVQRCLYFYQYRSPSGGAESTYGLSDVIYDYGAVCVSVVHGRKRLVALLARGIPNLELDSCVLVEGDGLGEEGGADGGFPVVVELVLRESAMGFTVASGENGVP
ncbi:hypothetical protein GMOD_00007160 [Pyrenophora seminiperda CCB06]|uniref:Uncharacterized protein n=1 Tax=Pyrenophora seminiperda CCB06 TaxID=1302712 RepID=A0A3M7MCG4_9PLEO|nr:hypothetical protein GMOD_00007160 [Pyrenophora seminiperda CCB06]